MTFVSAGDIALASRPAHDVRASDKLTSMSCRSAAPERAIAYLPFAMSGVRTTRINYGRTWNTRSYGSTRVVIAWLASTVSSTMPGSGVGVRPGFAVFGGNGGSAWFEV